MSDINQPTNESIAKPVEEPVIDLEAQALEEFKTTQTEVPIVEEVPVIETRVDAPVVEEPKPEYKQNCTLDYEYSFKANWDDMAEIFILPSDFNDNVNTSMKKAPNIDLGDNPSSRKWVNTVSKSLVMSPSHDMFKASLDRKDSKYHQGVEYNGSMLAGARPRHKALENSNIKGEAATLRVMTHLGLGSLFQVPLWHSGFWITFKPPTESELIEFNRLIHADKINFGRYTYGLAYSNILSYTVDRLINYALSHVFDTTVNVDEISISQLRDHISVNDIPSLLWGFICTVYPNGFQYRRACTDDPEKCLHIVEEKLNLPKLLWVDTTSLTDWQKTHMSDRSPKKKDKASILRYQDELKSQSKKRVSIGEEDKGLYFNLKTPSITQYVESGYEWISNIVNNVEKVISEDSTPEEKDKLIEHHGAASAMRQYSHYVESIEVDTNIIDDKETLDNNLNILSSDNPIRGKFLECITNYINDSTIAVIGIPTYDCPKCGKNQTEKIATFPKLVNIVPIDVIQVFFDLAIQRYERIQIR